MFEDNFCPLWSGSGSRIRMRIRIPGPHWIWIQFGSGSTTLLFRSRASNREESGPGSGSDDFDAISCQIYQVNWLYSSIRHFSISKQTISFKKILRQSLFMQVPGTYLAKFQGWIRIRNDLKLRLGYLSENTSFQSHNFLSIRTEHRHSLPKIHYACQIYQNCYNNYMFYSLITVI